MHPWSNFEKTDEKLWKSHFFSPSSFLIICGITAFKCSLILKMLKDFHLKIHLICEWFTSVHNLVRKGCLEIKIKTSLLHRTIKIMEPHLNWWLCPGLTRCISRFHNQNSYIITSFHELFENCRLSNALNDLHLVFKQCTYVRYPCKDKIKNYCFLELNRSDLIMKTFFEQFEWLASIKLWIKVTKLNKNIHV